MANNRQLDYVIKINEILPEPITNDPLAGACDEKTIRDFQRSYQLHHSIEPDEKSRVDENAIAEAVQAAEQARDEKTIRDLQKNYQQHTSIGKRGVFLVEVSRKRIHDHNSEPIKIAQNIRFIGIADDHLNSSPIEWTNYQDAELPVELTTCDAGRYDRDSLPKNSSITESTFVKLEKEIAWLDEQRTQQPDTKKKGGLSETDAKTVNDLPAQSSSPWNTIGLFAAGALGATAGYLIASHIGGLGVSASFLLLGASMGVIVLPLLVYAIYYCVGEQSVAFCRPSMANTVD